jgi:hypothetical protein
MNLNRTVQKVVDILLIHIKNLFFVISTFLIHTYMNGD